MSDLTLAVRLVLENGQYKAEVVNSEQVTKRFGATGKSSFNDLAEAAGRAPGPVGNAARSLQGLASSASLVRIAATGLVAAIGAVVIGVSRGTVVAGEHEQQLRRLEAQIKATGGAAGKSAQQLDEQSGALARSTLFSDDEIRAAQSRLLTFTSVSGAMFDRALVGATNLATIMGGLDTAVLALGKALEDPEEGLTALARAGIKFNDQQKKVIQGFVEAGEKGKALAAVLDVVENKIGPVAAAEADGYAGALHNLAEGWEDLLEAMGDTSTFRRATLAISELVDATRRLIAPTDAEKVTDLFRRRAALLASISKQETGGELSLFGGAEKLEKERAELAGIDVELSEIRQRRLQEAEEVRKRETEAERLQLAQQQDDRERFRAEQAKKLAKVRDQESKAADELREAMLSDDQAALQKSLEARQIAAESAVETEQALLERSLEKRQITEQQYLDGRTDLVEAAFETEIDIRERLLLIADAKEKAVVTAQIEVLKAKRLRALQEVDDKEREFAAARLQQLQGRVSGAVTRSQDGAVAIDARVSTGALSAAQGRGALAEMAKQSRTELQGLRTELLALLDKTPNDPAILSLLGQVQDAIRQARTEAEILGDRITGVVVDEASDSIADLALGAKSFSDAWEDAASDVISSIVRIVTQMLVMAAVQRAIGLFSGFGGGALPGLSTPIDPPRAAADGGHVQGPGTGTSDSIPHWLSNGEYVIKEKSVSKFGRTFFDALNAGFMPVPPRIGMAEGGYVGGGSAFGAGSDIADVKFEFIYKGEPMTVTNTERGSSPDARQLWRVFFEPELRRDLANNGQVSRDMASTFNLQRSQTRR